MSTADMRSARLASCSPELGQLTSAVVGGDGQLTALLDFGDRAVASLAQMMTTAGDSFARSLTDSAWGDEVVDRQHTGL